MPHNVTRQIKNITLVLGNFEFDTSLQYSLNIPHPVITHKITALEAITLYVDGWSGGGNLVVGIANLP